MSSIWGSKLKADEKTGEMGGRMVLLQQVASVEVELLRYRGEMAREDAQRKPGKIGGVSGNGLRERDRGESMRKRDGSAGSGRRDGLMKRLRTCRGSWKRRVR